MNKKEWRTAIQLRLKEFFKSPELVKIEQLRLHENLQNFLKVQSGYWGCFYPHQLEPDLRVVTKACGHLQFVYPKMNADQLEFWLPGTLGFEKGPFEVFEPIIQDAQKIQIKDISGFLVPGLGFDLAGHRLGKGKGFYDRLLRNWLMLPDANSPESDKENQVTKQCVGVCWDIQLEPNLPTEAHDIKMTALVTNKGVYKF